MIFVATFVYYIGALLKILVGVLLSMLGLCLLLFVFCSSKNISTQLHPCSPCPSSCSSPPLPQRHIATMINHNFLEHCNWAWFVFQRCLSICANLEQCARKLMHLYLCYMVGLCVCVFRLSLGLYISLHMYTHCMYIYVYICVYMSTYVCSHIYV